MVKTPNIGIVEGLYGILIGLLGCIYRVLTVADMRKPTPMRLALRLEVWSTRSLEETLEPPQLHHEPRAETSEPRRSQVSNSDCLTQTIFIISYTEIESPCYGTWTLRGGQILVKSLSGWQHVPLSPHVLGRPTGVGFERPPEKSAFQTRPLSMFNSRETKLHGTKYINNTYIGA